MIVANEKRAVNFVKKIKEQNTERFSDLQASLALSQLSRYDDFLSKRKIVAKYYFEVLPETATERLKRSAKGNIFFRFPLYGKFNFEKIKELMERKGIFVRKGVDSLIHRLMKLDEKNFPNAEETFKNTVSIPIYPALKKSEYVRGARASKEIVLKYGN